ncbi:tetratricopeptide repeat-containing diguanylate cyclase [Thalassotalea castellviae]|uniref:diguanylate cyclase n=1 Tax=Thalassotalea castellviae TaxID=3075612 RepID=A0ABU2ZZV8_9GAMM|nr:tetratricopeptide repeat-containing diguanylate cyclase [Thalassotalea sp. W431]MDT0603050.1 tetratricopeptide repeat-containing diguanylate cyclase [Thalassotalea sp. W431]
MLKFIYIFKFVIITILFAFMANGSANEQGQFDIKSISTANLATLDDQIFINPWLSLQALSQLAPEYPSMTQEAKIWWLLRKAQCENLLYFYQDLDQTLAQIAPLINNQTNVEQQARYHYFEGLSLQRKGGYHKSREFYRRSMDFAKQGNFSHLYIKAKKELAYTYSLAELFEISLKDMQEAYVEAYALNDRFLVAIINETYGAIYGYMLEHEKSIEYYQKALDSYESLNYKAHASEAIYGIASTYRYWQKYDLAIEYFKRYQKNVAFTPNENITYFGAYGLGMSLAEKGSCNEALPMIEHALNLNGLDDYDAELYKRKASCLIQLKRFDEAEIALTKVNELFQALPELMGTAWQLESLKIAAKLESERGNFEKGYQLLSRYNDKYTKLLIKNSSTRAITIRSAMELERQGIEKALINQRSKAELLEIKNREQSNIQQSYLIIFLLTLLMVVIAVVTFQYRNNRKMAELSITDPLSGLYNRRYIFQYLDKLIAATTIPKGHLSILVIDIDDFKKINDTYGHPIGDRVIEVVSTLAKNALRTEDVMGRIGGEEFLCVLPRADTDIAEKIAQRMKNEISAYKFDAKDDKSFSVTISVGISCYNEEVSDSKALYGLADQALYQAKETGKNRVNVF